MKTGLCYTDRQVTGQVQTSLPQTDADNVLLFGGTFDPPHVGHLTIAELAREQTGAEVWFLPAPSPPHKAGIERESYPFRAKMVDALIQHRDGLRLIDIETRLPSPSYTVDTVRACQTWYPKVHFSFLMGTDSLMHLPTWNRATELSQRIDFVVANRSGYPFEETFKRVHQELTELRVTQIEMPLLDISSTWLRDRLDRGLDIFHLVPQPVLNLWNQG